MPRQRRSGRVLRAGDQQGRPAPGGRPALGGVPLLAGERRRPEPVAAGRSPAGRAAGDDDERQPRHSRRRRSCRPSPGHRCSSARSRTPTPPPTWRRTGRRLSASEGTPTVARQREERRRRPARARGAGCRRLGRHRAVLRLRRRVPAAADRHRRGGAVSDGNGFDLSVTWDPGALDGPRLLLAFGRARAYRDHRRDIRRRAASRWCTGNRMAFVRPVSHRRRACSPSSAA